MSENGILALSRKAGETVILGDGVIEITVISIRGNKVRIAFKCPLNISIHRGEVFARIKANGISGASEVTE